LDTIVALSSPPVIAAANGAPSLAIIRLSGRRAIAIADFVFRVALPESLKPVASSVLPRAAKPARKIAATLAEASAEKKWLRVAGRVRWRGHELDAHVYIMRAPRSYTREDVVELHVPGLPWLIEELLDLLIAAGARAAQPGEFTRRAFENGRITLEQAAAVGKLIASSTAAEARAHAASLTAHAGVKRRKFKAELEELLAKVELGLDFAHEDVVVISLDELAGRLDELRISARILADESAREFERAPSARAPRIVLAGPTNAGKSRLFNALLERDAAIVSAERHTTRDAVEALIAFEGGLSAMLIDSAGSGDGDAETRRREDTEMFRDEALRLAAWSATRRELGRADVLLLALDRSIPPDTADGLGALLVELKALTPAASALIWTKSDLPAAASWRVDAPLDFAASARFEVSALSGFGIDMLRDFLAKRVAELSARSAEAHAAAGAAIRAAARDAADALDRAAEALRARSGEDVVAVELREAIHAFWRAEGILMRHDAVTEAALDKIFAEFCIGK